MPLFKEAVRLRLALFRAMLLGIRKLRSAIGFVLYCFCQLAKR
jgi:hypothetical protein